MPATLDQRDRDRLIKLLGMIGSSADGEALNAARLANRLVADRGLTWAKVLNGSPVPFSQPSWQAHWSPPPPPPPPPLMPWQAIARAILWHHAGMINDWEEHFLGSILTKRTSLSEKQRAAMVKIATKCGMAASMA